MEDHGPNKRLRLEVGGMTCPSCEHHVEQALREAGATDATADFRRNEVVFTVAGEPRNRSICRRLFARRTSSWPVCVRRNMPT
jgi:hypothetical protein